jgi:hypothetical protein
MSSSLSIELSSPLSSLVAVTDNDEGFEVATAGKNRKIENEVMQSSPQLLGTVFLKRWKTMFGKTFLEKNWGFLFLLQMLYY